MLTEFVNRLPAIRGNYVAQSHVVEYSYTTYSYTAAYTTAEYCSLFLQDCLTIRYSYTE